MKTPGLGTAAGMALGFAGFFGGFVALLLVAALGATGWAMGHWVDGGGRISDLRDVYERGPR